MTEFNQVSHVIFDMDGVILDTEPLYVKIIQNVVAKYGKTFSWTLREKVMGLHRSEAAKFIVKELDLPITWEEYIALNLKEYETVLNNPEIFPGAEKLVYHLSKHKIPMSVATSSSTDSYKIKTTNHQAILKLFDHIVCGSTDPEVKHGKPSPDIFLVSASRFPDKPKPEKCLVIEDAPNGVQAALNAGMQVIMVPNEHISAELCTGATLVVTSLDQIPLEKFGLPPFPDNQITCDASCKSANPFV